MVLGILMSIIVFGAFLWCVFQGSQLFDDILRTFKRGGNKR